MRHAVLPVTLIMIETNSRMAPIHMLIAHTIRQYPLGEAVDRVGMIDNRHAITVCQALQLRMIYPW